MTILDFHGITLIIAYVLFVLITFFVQKIRGRRPEIWYNCIWILYLVLLIKVTVFPIVLLHQDARSVFAGTKSVYTQFVPLQTFLNMKISKTWLLQTVGNLMLLFPLPVLLYIKPNREYRLRVLLISGILVSLGIEVLQLLIDVLTGYPSHVCDVDDLILNSVGVILATVLCKTIPRKKKEV